jgi:transcription termination/antitermination protein NusG
MFRWYVINTYSGHENKVKQNLEHRVSSLNQTRSVRRVVVPTEPIPLTQGEVDRLLHKGGEQAVRVPSRAQFSIGESVKVISGPLSDFSGEISEINEDASKLKVLVSIFGRETPVEVGYDQVKKI